MEILKPLVIKEQIETGDIVEYKGIACMVCIDEICDYCLLALEGSRAGQLIRIFTSRQELEAEIRTVLIKSKDVLIQKKLVNTTDFNITYRI